MEIFSSQPEETMVKLELSVTVDGVKHLWLSIADYNARRVQGGEEPLPFGHPLMGMQHTITGMLDELISGGMRDGFNVGPLIEVKQLISDAADQFAEGNGGVDA